MDIINILPDSVANQIAAGEVVDRPAGAVKELLENAMDAGATQIDLIVKDAGRTLIQVVDNGCGMSDADARLCFERHATSKIHRADDLFAIHTMGFRGEALASIAAIAQVDLCTRQHDSELGTQVTIEGSVVKEQHPTVCRPGTSMAVKNLFFNVPARRNFLKKDSVEMSHIEEVFRRITLVHYDIGFSLTANGRLVYDLKGGSMLQRIAGLFGNQYRERLFNVEESTDVVRIKGFVSKPEYCRRTRGEQYLFVNGRFIKHPAFSAAIEKAYATMLPEKSYPSYFIGLQVDPSRIDVNIHPTKTEVKFADESVLFSLLHAAVKKSLGQFTLATEIDFSPATEIDFTPAPRGYVPHEPKVSFRADYNPFERPAPKQARLTLDFLRDNRDAQAPQAAPAPEPAAPAAAPATAEPPQARMAAPANTCMQVQNRYVVTPLASGLAVIDQQRAHERVLFDRLMRSPGTAAAQALLFPERCQFSPADAELLAELLPDLRAFGFELEPAGTTAFVVTATPFNMPDTAIQGFLEQLVSDYKGSTMQKFSNRSESLCASIARQTAVRAGTPMNPDEMQQLVADLFACPLAEVSPSGKRTITIVKPEELLK